VTFNAAWDDGMRVWLNGTLLFDRWGALGSTSVTRSLTDGIYEIRVEHNENKGNALARLDVVSGMPRLGRGGGQRVR
jgi:hypothetical protein